LLVLVEAAILAEVAVAVIVAVVVAIIDNSFRVHLKQSLKDGLTYTMLCGEATCPVLKYFIFLEPEKCKPLRTISENIPIELWTASGFDENDTLEMGETLQFKCPTGLSLSFDDDKFGAFDDR
jgi:hypothetical protein